ncbi:MAG TPA: hypothetical protein VHA73_02395 [Acidimicrobiales bacterium]|jgi:hypothetical protein|nr:hypothetical protein [Acidimicrobiales bacterium]
MSSMQLDYTTEDILADHAFAEPLIADGIRCHGGFTAEGAYVSPRTAHRVDAIANWQAHHRDTFGTDLLDPPLETWPGHYPNLPQARFLLDHGVREPIVAILTRIGTVEGFGGLIRTTPIPNWERIVDEDLRHTATAHLPALYEAHARDEAGHEDDAGNAQAGHKQMWFSARDIAFEHPVSGDQTALMLERMGIAPPGSGGKIDPERMRAEALANRTLPDDVDFDLEQLLNRMISLLFIEISAFHAFAWAEALLDDPERVAGDGEAARIVSYIRTDETPHVGYLKTSLTELRDRTFISDKGRRVPGAEIVGPVWDQHLASSLGERREAQLDAVYREVQHALEGRRNAADLLAEFDTLGDTARGADGAWHSAAAN